MTATRALEIVSVLQAAGVRACVDGGWGIDALVGRQTRAHDDLDLVVELEAVPVIATALSRLGFVISEDHLPVRFVMRDPAGAQLDFHTVTFDAEGGGLQPQPAGGVFRYPPEGFVTGSIGGQAVACVSAPVQVLCHLGYEPTEKDAHDVLLICRTFNFPVPPAYARFLGEGVAPCTSMRRRGG